MQAQERALHFANERLKAQAAHAKTLGSQRKGPSEFRGFPAGPYPQLQHPCQQPDRSTSGLRRPFVHPVSVREACRAPSPDVPRQGSRARLGVWGLVLLSVLARFSQLCVSWDKSLPLFELSFRVLSEAVAQMTEGGAFAALRAGDGGTKACQ